MASHTLLCWLFFAILLSSYASEAKVALRAQETPQCASSEWIPSAETGSCYLVTMNPERYSNANTVCASILEGTTIAYIATQAEQTFLEGVLKDNVWIGGNDRDTEGTFVWSDGKPFEFTSWAAGEPSGHGYYTDEDCVEMNKDLGYKWNDEGCLATRKVLCEKVVIQPTAAPVEEPTTEPQTTTTEATEPPTTEPPTTEPPTTQPPTTEAPTTEPPTTEPPTTEAPTTEPPATEPPTTTTTTTQKPYSYVCPSSWVLNEDHCYLISPSTAQWTAARDKCILFSSHLAKIDNSLENNFLRLAIGTSNVWFGLNDRDTEGKLNFVSDGSAPSYTNWATGEPNDNTSKDDEDCVELKTSGTWNDLLCTYTKPYVCERAAEHVQWPRTSCPSGWKSDGGNNCYHKSSASFTFDDARTYCLEVVKDSTFLLPTSKAENDFAVGQYKVEYWIDLNDNANEGTYVTSAGTKPNYTIWNSGEPNDGGWWVFVKENCAVTRVDGYWSDRSCSSTYPAVCKVTL